MALLVTLQVVAFLLAITATIVCDFGNSQFDSSPFLFGHKIKSSLGMILEQGSPGDVYQGDQRGSLSPGTHPNVNCC